MQNKSWVLLLTLFLVSVISGCWADQVKEDSALPPVSSEQTKPVTEKKHVNEGQKAETIKSILQAHDLKLHRAGMDEAKIAFCERLYADLKRASPDVHYIEPILRTDDPQHPGLAEYRKCESYPHPERVYQNYEPFLGLWHVGSFNYKLYREDFDQDKTNGLEEIIYADIGKEKERYEQVGGYMYVDTDKCRVLQTYEISADYRKLPKKLGGHSIKVENFNALVSYQESKYIFELFDSFGHYKFYLYKIQNKNEFSSYCTGW